MIFLGRIFIILLLKKNPKQHGQGKFLKKIQKKLSHFKEKNYEIVKHRQMATSRVVIVMMLTTFYKHWILCRDLLALGGFSTINTTSLEIYSSKFSYLLFFQPHP